MAEKKIGDVEASVRALRERRYMTRGPGARSKAPSLTAQRIDQLKQEIAAIPPTKSRAEKKAAKKRKPHGRR